jgi:thiamine-phosphate pyrophosphorylase
MAHLRPTTDPIGEQRRGRLAAARLYLVCDCAPGGRDLGEFLREAIAGGVDIVQLRDKHLDDERLIETAALAAEVSRTHGALFILNDRPDIASKVPVDGVHLGQEDMPPDRAREIVGPDVLIGLSTHAPREIAAAVASTPDGEPYVDYIGVGPVHATPTKPGRAPVGLELVGHAQSHAKVPFFAIGGITPDNLTEVAEAGARKVAIVRALTESPDPKRAATALRAKLEKYQESHDIVRA